MSDDAAKRPRGLIVRPSYAVGYGKPPEESRFRKGQSGNPGGRSKGTKNWLPYLNEERMKNLLLTEAYRPITVRDGNRNLTVPMAQAILRSLAVSAAKGNHRSQRLFAELLSATETANKALADKLLDGAMTYKIAWEKELRRREVLGITDLPPPLPHPDHILIDMSTGRVRFRGPSTKEEKVMFEAAMAEKQKIAGLVALCRVALERERDPEERADLARHIDIGETVLARHRTALPDDLFPLDQQQIDAEIAAAFPKRARRKARREIEGEG